MKSITQSHETSHMNQPRIRLAVCVLTLVALGLSLVTANLQAQSPILHYSLNQSTGTTAFDSAENPANGTLTGAGSSWTDDGLPGAFVASHAYRNSGANGTYITGWDQEKLRNLGDFTMTGWLNVREASVAAFAQDRVMSKRGTSGDYYDLTFGDAGDGNIGLRLDISTGTSNSQILSNAMDMGEWFFFAVSRNASTGEILFYYGTPTGDFSAAGGGTGVTGIVGNNTAQFMIGNAAANTARAPNADFSDMRLYGAALGSNDIQQIMGSALIPETNTILISLVASAAVLLIRFRKISMLNK